MPAPTAEFEYVDYLQSSKAARDVMRERLRQIVTLGRTDEHDDQLGFSEWVGLLMRHMGRLADPDADGSAERRRRIFVIISAVALAAADSIDRKATGDG